MPRLAPLYLLLALLLAAQGAFWWRTHSILPDMSIVPPVPGKAEVEALSFGDKEFYFREQALTIQNCGDTYGRFSPLYRYDFAKLYGWFHLLDTLDARSDLVPAMAAYYFSQTQKTQDARYVVNYLYEHSAPNPKKNWWWLVQAVYIANHKLGDKDLAMKVAEPLTRTRDIPIWAQQMPAFIHEQRGEFDDALAIMEGIQRDIKNIPAPEIKFMRYFIDERLHALDEWQKDMKK